MILRSILGWVQRLFTGRSRPFRTVFRKEIPDCLEKNVIYICGEGGHLWFAAMRCPCGCGETLQMSLHKEGRPRWELIRHSDGTVSLRPSIWRKRGCGSHFFFERGRVKWCSGEK